LDAVFNGIIIYARDVHKSAEFYRKYFGFASTGEIVEGLIDLTSMNGGSNIRIHQAAKGIKLGQVGVKLVFDVPDVEAFKKKAASLGLRFGSSHIANGYSFANAKDPDKNSVCISSRAYRTRASVHQG
jgi:predicted enzyme related to lactoylglutathione lyase